MARSTIHYELKRFNIIYKQGHYPLHKVLSKKQGNSFFNKIKEYEHQITKFMHFDDSFFT